VSSTPRAQLEQKLAAGTAVVGVVGLGYVGLPLCRAFVDACLPVMGFDIDPAKIAAIARGENYLPHLGEDFVAPLAAGGRFRGTTDFSQLREADAILICVPTPLGPHMEPDLSYVERTARDIAASLRPGQLVSLESTTYPGTTRELVLPILQATGLRAGEAFFLAYSPEREDPGRRDHSTRSIPKLVGGIDDASLALAAQLYSKAVERVVPVSSAEVAESAKLLENIYRAVNIALVNEMKGVMAAMGIDLWEVIDAAATKPFGYQPFYPGPGLGGHCIPIDPFYLSWKARAHGLATRFIELAGEINHAMPGQVVQRVAMALNDNAKALRGSRVLVLGIAYKKNVADVRESPGMVLIEQLRAAGAHVDYSDPHVPRTHRMRRHDLKMASVPLDPPAIAGYDCVLVAADHDAFDWPMIAAHARLIVDTRNAIRQRGLAHPRLVLA
jgi:UDP-N-acetyl-D-glucosamine dehydrogenase